MDNQPTISVIIPLYNHKNTIFDCIESVKAQTADIFEIIVVDDGSSDGGGDVVKNIEGVKYIQQDNAGAPAARNHGFRESNGDYVIFCDADVIMEPRMIASMLDALEENPMIGFAYSGFIFGKKTFKGLPFSIERLHKINYIHTTSLIRRGAFPGFDESVKRLQDWDLWLTMVERDWEGICVSKEPLFTIQVDGPSRIGSYWVPKIFYKLPWHVIGWAPKPVAKYFEAREFLMTKHPQLRGDLETYSKH